MPRISNDDFIDFCVTESLVVRAAEERKEAEKQQKIRDWKKGAKDLLTGGGGGSRL